MRTTLALLAALGLAACGGPPRPPPGPGPTPPPDAGPPPPPSGPTLAGTAPLPPGDDAFGPGFSRDGVTVLLAAGGQLHRFDARTLAPIDARPIATVPRLGAAVPVVLVGRQGGGEAALDPAAAARLAVLPPPAGYNECGEPAFSADAARMSRNCLTAAGDDRVVVQDTRTGAVIAELSEFQTAAPVRAGAITDSGNFVFWSARASGAFEEIKSKVTGPMTSSHSTMSPDERALFTVADKNWMPDDHAPARVLDPSNGRTRYTLPYDIDRVYFSPDSARFVAIHLSDEARAVAAVTIHRTDDGTVLATLADRDVELAAFSPDARALAVRGASAIRLYVGIP